MSASRLDKAAATFVRERPDCIRLLVRLARAKKADGERRISAKGLFEEARPKLRRGRKAGKPWTLNNSLTSRVARLIEKNWPEFKGYFEMRALRS